MPENIEIGPSVKLNKNCFCLEVTGYPVLQRHFRKLQANISDGFIADVLKNFITFSDLPLDVQVEVFFCHHRKTIVPYISKTKNPDEFGKKILEIRNSYENKKVIDTIEMFMEIFYNSVSADLLKEMYEILKSTKGSSAAIRKIKINSGLMNKLLLKNDVSLLPAEYWILEKCGKTEFVIEIEFNNAYYRKSDLPDIYDIEGNKLKPFVLKWMLLFTDCRSETGIPSERSEFIKLIDHDKFMESLWYLFEKYNFTFIYPICRYADEELMKRLIKKTHGSSLRNAALYSDTKSAMFLADKFSNLGEYASLRGIDENILRDKYMSDIGIDEHGRKSYDLGSQTVTAQLQKDLTFVLISETGKILKSLPEKNAVPEKYEQAKLDFSNMKKDSKKILKNRARLLFAQFLNGTASDSEQWGETYLKNPLLRSVAKLIVWQQDNKTFSVNDSGLYMSDGSFYELTGSPVITAHPMTMDAADLRAWQKYFNENNLKQPFVQIWEPYVAGETVKKDRYKGCFITLHDLGKRKEHGITVDTIGDRYYGYEVDISFDDCDTENNYVISNNCWGDGSDTCEITDFSFEQYTRKVNHIVTYLDSITVSDRIKKDDVTIESQLPDFTLAQITEFINIAAENNCTNVTALLLNYKNEHFADFEPMDDFVLGYLL